MPRKPLPWPGLDFVLVVRQELDPLLTSLGFQIAEADQGEKNKRSPTVRYRRSTLHLQLEWDPWDALLEIKLGPRFHMQDVIPRVIVHTHYQFYLEAMGIADIAPTYEQYQNARNAPESLWRESCRALRETLPKVMERYDEVRPLTELVSKKRLPNLVLLGEHREA